MSLVATFASVPVASVEFFLFGVVERAVSASSTVEEMDDDRDRPGDVVSVALVFVGIGVGFVARAFEAPSVATAFIITTAGAADNFSFVAGFFFFGSSFSFFSFVGIFFSFCSDDFVSAAGVVVVVVEVGADAVVVVVVVVVVFGGSFISFGGVGSVVWNCTRIESKNGCSSASSAVIRFLGS